jgi:hypothetical protein
MFTISIPEKNPVSGLALWVAGRFCQYDDIKGFRPFVTGYKCEFDPVMLLETRRLAIDRRKMDKYVAAIFPTNETRIPFGHQTT